MRLFKTLPLLASLVVSQAAFAALPTQVKDGTEIKQLDRIGRFDPYVIPQVRTLANGNASQCTVTSTAITSIPVAISTTLKASMAGFFVSSVGAASLTGWTITTSIAPMFYSGKVQVGISDAGGGSAPTCRYVELCGDLWNGSYYCEIHNGINSGTAQVGEANFMTSDSSFSRLTRVRVAECTSVDSNDVVFVRQTGHIALPRRISSSPSTQDVLSVCFSTYSGSSASGARCVDPSLLSFDTTFRANSVNIVDADFRAGSSLAGCPPENSTFQIRYFASPRAQAY